MDVICVSSLTINFFSSVIKKACCGSKLAITIHPVSSHWRCSMKISVLKNFEVHFFRPAACNFIKKETPKQVFFMQVFFHEHSQITGQRGKGEDISLTPLYLFHPLHKNLDIDRQPLVSERKSLTTKLDECFLANFAKLFTEHLRATASEYSATQYFFCTVL